MRNPCRCEICGKLFVPRRGSTGRFCSHACSYQGRPRKKSDARDCECGLTTFAKTSLCFTAIVDVEDGHLLRDYKWSAKGRCLEHAFYARSSLYARENQIPDEDLHVAVMRNKGPWDHINGDGHDNRKSNLRPAGPSENGQNRRRPSNNTSGYKGVSRSKDGGRDWFAIIQFNGVQKHLGHFSNPEQAALAYNYNAAHLFGEFARLNRLPENVGWDGLERTSDHD
jgi:hypothetical protein